MGGMNPRRCYLTGVHDLAGRLTAMMEQPADQVQKSHYLIESVYGRSVDDGQRSANIVSRVLQILHEVKVSDNKLPNLSL